ncbi:hypothetical protein JZ751_005292 [Albula glossodonta]|uniref:SH3 domain-containing protein n=1 Tax=Albula glossodonta TaxID=121402 RepID=A0A8T2N7J7_9TELE|nr:hypothetical protein JZ751_005292 [Albula glossodonta]
MDFNVKKLASDAGVFFTRAVQFTEEKLGQAEKTELDVHLENLLARADCTKNWTEKIFRQTEVLLQPNPSARIEEFFYEKLDRKIPSRTTNGELLGQYMLDAAKDFGPATPPLRNFLEGDWRTISKERRLLENRRLDLDICKARLKKAKAAEAKAAVHHLRCLHEFVEAQAAYYAHCHQHMQDLQRELSSPSPSTSACPGPTPTPTSSTLSPLGGASAVSMETDTLRIEEVRPPASGTRKAKVLYDYDAADTSELSLRADELITVYTVPGMDPDWLIGERGNQKGKVPVTYLELLS